MPRPSVYRQQQKKNDEIKAQIQKLREHDEILAELYSIQLDK